MFKIFECKTTGDYKNAGILIRTYSDFLGLDLDYQEFEKELESLGKIYSENQGAFFLAEGPDAKFFEVCL